MNRGCIFYERHGLFSWQRFDSVPAAARLGNAQGLGNFAGRILFRRPSRWTVVALFEPKRIEQWKIFKLWLRFRPDPRSTSNKRRGKPVSVIFELRRRAAWAWAALDRGDIEAARKTLDDMAVERRRVAVSPETTLPATWRLNEARRRFEKIRLLVPLSAFVAVDPKTGQPGDAQFHFSGHEAVIAELERALTSHERTKAAFQDFKPIKGEMP